MSLNRFFTYFGGKNEHAKRYPPPAHDTIIEPFAGAAGYSTKHHRNKVILVEKDPIVASLWRYLLTATAGEIMRLPLITKGQHIDELGLAPGARALVSYWLGVNAQGHTRLSPRALGEGGGSSNPEWWWSRTVRARLASQVDKIRHWQIIEGTYADAPDVEATWFIDPPYEVAGTAYRCGARDLNFAALGAWCKNRRGQVMVCEQEGAAWLPFRPFYSQKTTVGTFSREVIWTNDRADIPPSAKPCDTPP
jgi:hypothetical protein